MNNAENTVLLAHTDQFNDELSLLDLVTFIKNNWLGILGGALTGAALGFAIAFALPSQWEANALVRIGQLGNIGAAVEPPLQLVDRIKSQSFQDDVLTMLGLNNSDYDDKAKAFRESLKVKLEKSELISLALRGTSASAVKLQMGAIISELKAVHSKMSAPTIHHLQQELVAIDQELKRASVESDRLKKSLNSLTALDAKSFPQAALVGNILIVREAELRAFRERKRALEEQLSPERTFSSDVLGRIEISSEPVFPKKSLFAMAGLFIGLLLGVLFAMLKSNDFLRLASRKSV